MFVFLEPLKSSSCAPHPELFPKSQRVFDAKEPQEFINTALCDDVFLEKSQTHVIFVEPALKDVYKEFRRLGYETELFSDFDAASNIPTHVLLVNIENQRRFQYFVAPVPTPIPSFGGRRAQTEDSYYRLEVFNQTGTEGYDLMGLSKQQVIDDVIDRYETHMTFLTLTFNLDNPSFLTPPQPPVAEPALAEQEEEIVTEQQQLETGESDRT